MNIYAINGHKIKCTYLDLGYNYQIERAHKHLKLGQVYTVDYTEVHNESTDVFLLEIPDIAFNSTCFEDVQAQSVENDRKHEDYDRYHDC